MLYFPILCHAKRKPTWRLRVIHVWLAKLAWYDITWKSSILNVMPQLLQLSPPPPPQPPPPLYHRTPHKGGVCETGLYSHFVDAFNCLFHSVLLNLPLPFPLINIPMWGIKYKGTLPLSWNGTVLFSLLLTFHHLNLNPTHLMDPPSTSYTFQSGLRGMKSSWHYG